MTSQIPEYSEHILSNPSPPSRSILLARDTARISVITVRIKGRSRHTLAPQQHVHLRFLDDLARERRRDVAPLARVSIESVAFSRSPAEIIDELQPASAHRHELGIQGA